MLYGGQVKSTLQQRSYFNMHTQKHDNKTLLASPFEYRATVTMNDSLLNTEMSLWSTPANGCRKKKTESNTCTYPPINATNCDLNGPILCFNYLLYLMHKRDQTEFNAPDDTFWAHKMLSEHEFFTFCGHRHIYDFCNIATVLGRYF